jgi:hypothetical protein
VGKCFLCLQLCVCVRERRQLLGQCVDVCLLRRDVCVQSLVLELCVFEGFLQRLLPVERFDGCLLLLELRFLQLLSV